MIISKTIKDSKNKEININQVPQKRKRYNNKIIYIKLILS